MDVALRTVVYLGEPDVVYEFRADGERRTFGRDDDNDIVIWSALNHTRLSACAGVIWQMDGELWLRNLSQAHDLYLEVPGRPAEPPLPPRRDEHDRGAARSIPGDLAYLKGPDGCHLRVRHIRAPRLPAAGESLDVGTGTLRLPPIPAELRMTAIALCEPLFSGGQLPASYAQIGVRTGVSSRKAVRNQVERLTDLYLEEIPSLREIVQGRIDRDAAQLGLSTAPRVVRGIQRFDRADSELVDGAEQERRSALALPTYFEVAHLLVRRHTVREEHVTELGAQPDDGAAAR